MRIILLYIIKKSITSMSGDPIFCCSALNFPSLLFLPTTRIEWEERSTHKLRPHITVDIVLELVKCFMQYGLGFKGYEHLFLFLAVGWDNMRFVKYQEWIDGFEIVDGERRKAGCYMKTISDNFLIKSCSECP